MSKSGVYVHAFFGHNTDDFAMHLLPNGFD